MYMCIILYIYIILYICIIHRVLDGDDDRIRKLLSSLQNGSYMKLVDFDSHLDSCVDTDWTNPTVNTLIDEQSSN